MNGPTAPTADDCVILGAGPAGLAVPRALWTAGYGHHGCGDCLEPIGTNPETVNQRRLGKPGRSAKQDHS